MTAMTSPERMAQGRPPADIRDRLRDRMSALRSAGLHTMEYGPGGGHLTAVGHTEDKDGEAAAFAEADQIAELLALWARMPLTPTEAAKLDQAIREDAS